jgi:RNA recognition motif
MPPVARESKSVSIFDSGIDYDNDDDDEEAAETFVNMMGNAAASQHLSGPPQHGPPGLPLPGPPSLAPPHLAPPPHGPPPHGMPPAGPPPNGPPPPMYHGGNQGPPPGPHGYHHHAPSPSGPPPLPHDFSHGGPPPPPHAYHHGPPGPPPSDYGRGPPSPRRQYGNSYDRRGPPGPPADPYNRGHPADVDRARKYFQHRNIGFVIAQNQDRARPGFTRCMSTVLFVGFVPQEVPKEDVTAAFRTCGNVVSTVRSQKGDYFIGFSSRFEAAQAIQQLSQETFGAARPVRISWAKGTAIEMANYDRKTGECFIPQADADAILAHDPPATVVDVDVPSINYFAARPRSPGGPPGPPPQHGHGQSSASDPSYGNRKRDRWEPEQHDGPDRQRRRYDNNNDRGPPPPGPGPVAAAAAAAAGDLHVHPSRRQQVPSSDPDPVTDEPPIHPDRLRQHENYQPRYSNDRRY